MGNWMTNYKDQHANSETKGIPQKETQMDSILINGLILLGHGKVVDVRLGLVNSVHEEIDRLIEEYDLHVPPNECELLIVESSGNTIVMEPHEEVQWYLDKLTRSSNILRLVHTKPSQNAHTANLGVLGIKVKTTD